jgi:hypothetical protein
MRRSSTTKQIACSVPTDRLVRARVWVREIIHNHPAQQRRAPGAASRDGSPRPEPELAQHHQADWLIISQKEALTASDARSVLLTSSWQLAPESDGGDVGDSETTLGVPEALAWMRMPTRCHRGLVAG